MTSTTRPVERAHVRLPEGVADHPPAAARALDTVLRAVTEVFELHGYARVVTPLFELLSTLERGLGEATRGSLFRMVDPASGEVVALRPDFTAQVARLVVARMAGHTRPLRLYYHGRVARAADPLGRGLTRRDLFQAGVELIGVAGRWAEIEILSVSAACFLRLGRRVVIDLGHAAIVRALLEEPHDPQEVHAALAQRDATWLRKVAPALEPLADLHGDIETLARARAVLARAPRAVHAALDELEDVAKRLRGMHEAVEITIDLAEERNLGYYTGLFFHGYTDGAADHVFTGGRYDDLLARFGRAEPAVGLTVDIGRLSESSFETAALFGVVLAEEDLDRPRLTEEAARLRERGERAVLVAAAEAEAYARAHGYRAIMSIKDGGSIDERPLEP